MQKYVFYEFRIRVEAERLMIYIAAFSIGRNRDARHTQATAVLIGFRGNDMIIEAAPIAPREKNDTVLPIRPLHDGVNQGRRV